MLIRIYYVLNDLVNIAQKIKCYALCRRHSHTWIMRWLTSLSTVRLNCIRCDLISTNETVLTFVASSTIQTIDNEVSYFIIYITIVWIVFTSLSRRKFDIRATFKQGKKLYINVRFQHPESGGVSMLFKWIQFSIQYMTNLNFKDYSLQRI